MAWMCRLSRMERRTRVQGTRGPSLYSYSRTTASPIDNNYKKQNARIDERWQDMSHLRSSGGLLEARHGAEHEKNQFGPQHWPRTVCLANLGSSWTDPLR